MTRLVEKMSIKWLIFCVFIQIGRVLGDERNTFRDDYDYSGEIDSYFKVHFYPRSWLNARTRCRQEGAQLFTPANNQEADFVKSLYDILPQNFEGLYLGLNAYWSEGDFASVEEKSVVDLYNLWNENEPNNLNDNENCAMMTSNGKYSDVACQKVLPFLCVRSEAGLTWNSACKTYDMGYQSSPSLSSCYKIHTDPKNWTNAYQVCKAEGGYLAIVNTDAQKNFLVQLFERHPASSLRGNFEKVVLLIGFHDLFVDREFEYIDGSRVLFYKFNAKQPDDHPPGQRCGGMYRDGSFDDIWCDRPNIFACERPITGGLGKRNWFSPRKPNGMREPSRYIGLKH